MGFAFTMKVKKENQEAVEAAISEMQNYVEKELGGYDGNYSAWRLFAHMGFIDLETYSPKEYWEPIIKSQNPGPDEVILYHHEIPWLFHISKDILNKSRDCFDRYDVINVWWAIVAESAAGMNDIETLFPGIKRNVAQ